MHLRNCRPLTEYCCKNDKGHAICGSLWSSVSRQGTQCASTLLNPKSWMMLMTVPCNRLKSCCSSLIIILLLLQIAFSTSGLQSYGLVAVGLPLHSQSSLLALPP
jgi:hypothetical protein